MSAQRRVCASVVKILAHKRVEHTPLEPLPAFVWGGVRQEDLSEDAVEEITRAFLNRRGDRAVLVVTVDVPAQSAAPKEGTADQRRNNARRLSVGIVHMADHLVNRGAAGAGIALGGSAVKAPLEPSK